MRNGRLIVLAILVLGLAARTAGQDPYSVSGRVLEEKTRQPLEYTNIVLFRSHDSTQVTGTVTDKAGAFEISGIPPGEYYLRILFLGYETSHVPLHLVGSSVDLGSILLVPSSILLGDVIVQSDRPPLTYEIDRKILDVSEIHTTISGTAAEVLENIPSVSVDIEGNVNLRGSGNFTVLIDGRPTILDAQDALQQIPASAIGRIEIITNPSAKYDPEGTAGIINIVMARRDKRGLSGIVTGNLGWNEKYGGDLLLEYKSPGLSALFGADHNNRFFPGTEWEKNSHTYQGTTTHTETSGDSRRGRVSWGIRGAVEFTPSPKNVLTLGLRHGQREHGQNSLLQHDQWSEAALLRSVNTNTVQRQRGGDFTSVNLHYLHAFSADGHELNADLQFGFDRSDEFTLSELHDGPSILTGRRTTEAGPETEFEGKIEYVLPLAGGSRFEAGYQGESELSEERTGLTEYDTTTGAYWGLPQYSRKVLYDVHEHAIYSLFAGEVGAFGFQAGMRAEYTLRNIRLNETGEKFLVDKLDYFPTIHGSFKFGAVHQLLASYTRRINRPRGWELEPFETWMDANNVRRGNPSLLPEYIDSYELGAQTVIGGATVSAEFYRTVTHNKIEDIRTVYAEDVTLRTMGNVGKDFSLGTEFLANFDLAEGWNVNLIGNLYQYEIEGVVLGKPFNRSSFNWTARVNNSLKVGPSTQLQLNGRLHSPTVSAQGRREGFVSADLAIRQDFFGNQLSAILQVRDVFGTRTREFSSDGEGFSSHSISDRESPVFMLTLRYRLNEFEQEEDREEEEFESDEF
ncbi:MAG TPA: outer membrane beta-barrel family protein [Bacteroidota bacterium]